MGTSRRSQLSSRKNKAQSLTAIGDRRNPIAPRHVRELSIGSVGYLDATGRATPLLARELRRIERACEFTAKGREAFQGFLGKVGVSSAKPIGIPSDDQPYWFRFEHPLKESRSLGTLPTHADVVVIGAGLTGASSAYHLREAAAGGCRVLVLEKGFPGCEASGRNAGNFELLPENSVGIYDGLPRERLLFLRRCYPSLPQEILRLEAERQASHLLGFALRNRDLLKKIVEREHIDCDYSPRGWLYLAHTEREEQAICDEVTLAAEQDQCIEVWSRLRIRQEFGFERNFIGRFIPGDGTYHPYKLVYGLLQLAVDAGVELYTGVSVNEVRSEGGGAVIVTDRGTVRCSKVIVATNAFTSKLFPELRAIQPAQSQICVTEFAPDKCRGRVITSEEGPVYFNQPRATAHSGVAPLLMGGGRDRPMRNPWSRRRSPQVHAKLLTLRDRFFPELSRQPFSTEWVGPIALTPDQVPAIGILRPGVIIAAGFNGYGGSYCCAAGEAAAFMANSGKAPDWFPEDIFSPKRLLDRQPVFANETESLWGFASALCIQLRAVDARIREVLSGPIRTGRRKVLVATPKPSVSAHYHAPASAVSAELLHSLRCFRSFTREECECILSLGRAWRARRGDIVCSEGSTGDSCFVVVSGAINVILDVDSREQLLARLGPGRFFGEVAFIEGGNRTATCVVQKDAVLLEILRDPCEALFASRSPLAYKFLTALAEGLIADLRSANRRLIRCALEDRLTWSLGEEEDRQNRKSAGKGAGA